VSDEIDERAHQRVGSVLDEKWKLERLIGIGGMAAVYAGLHRNGARAAIKVLHHTYARRSAIRDRFLREGYAANRVKHSGVVKVLDDDVIQGGLDDGGAFLVMELLEGQSIEDRLERGPPISEGELLAILRAVLDVLDVAHKEGIIHRDLKPENIFLARDPEKPDAPPKIKILDFGLARIDDLGGKTVVGLAIGTPSYMPPEQATGRVLEIDNRSDLFALGATAFRIAAGRTVHPAEDAVAICTRMATEPAPSLHSVAPNISAGTAAVIDRALAFERSKRWPDAAAMRAAVGKAIGALGGETITIDSGMIDVSIEVEPLREASRVLARERSSRSSRPPPKQRSSWFVRLLIVILAIVAAKLGYDVYGKTLLAALRPPDEPSEAHATEETLSAAVTDAGATDAHTDAPAQRHDAGHKHPTNH
jgi:serine/threonine protein kinase